MFCTTLTFLSGSCLVTADSVKNLKSKLHPKCKGTCAGIFLPKTSPASHPRLRSRRKNSTSNRTFRYASPFLAYMGCMTINFAGQLDRVKIIKELVSQGVYKGVFRMVRLRMEGTLHAGGRILCAGAVDWTKRRECPERKSTSLLPWSTIFHLKCHILLLISLYLLWNTGVCKFCISQVSSSGILYVFTLYMWVYSFLWYIWKIFNFFWVIILYMWYTLEVHVKYI